LLAANASLIGSGTRAATRPRWRKPATSRLNGRRITAASQLVKFGDVVTLALGRSVRVIRVEGLCDSRGVAAAARALYLDMTRAPAPEA